ncbi:hypothetical protein JHW43_000075 [Diplocarpon mali]|nr:hypothetical protein JHW43_000075 [Diplocarpon mali]
MASPRRSAVPAGPKSSATASSTRPRAPVRSDS